MCDHIKNLEIACKDYAILGRDAPRFCHVCQSHKDRGEFDDSGICFDCFDELNAEPPTGGNDDE